MSKLRTRGVKVGQGEPVSHQAEQGLGLQTCQSRGRFCGSFSECTGLHPRVTHIWGHGFSPCSFPLTPLELKGRGVIDKFEECPALEVWRWHVVISEVVSVCGVSIQGSLLYGDRASIQEFPENGAIYPTPFPAPCTGARASSYMSRSLSNTQGGHWLTTGVRSLRHEGAVSHAHTLRN